MILLALWKQLLNFENSSWNFFTELNAAFRKPNMTLRIVTEVTETERKPFTSSFNIYAKACYRNRRSLPSPPLSTTLFPRWSVDISYKDDVTVILLLGASFMKAAYDEFINEFHNYCVLLKDTRSSLKRVLNGFSEKITENIFFYFYHFLYSKAVRIKIVGVDIEETDLILNILKTNHVT
jgi:hypothetical protein